jgi:hypothetical protein
MSRRFTTVGSELENVLMVLAYYFMSLLFRQEKDKQDLL